MMTTWAWWVAGRVAAVPTKLKLYAGVAVVVALALLRWRALGIRAAIDELKKRDEARAQQLRERAAVARSDHPDGDNDIIERLRAHGRLRGD